MSDSECSEDSKIEERRKIAIRCNEEGCRLLEKNKNEEARRLFKLAIEFSPNSFEYHYNSALTFYKLNRLDESIEATLKCIELEPEVVIGYMLK
ncbi:hypothetical protein B4U80_14186, partial [Leptotrombidium deliense]